MKSLFLDNVSEYLWRIQVYGIRKAGFKEFLNEDVIPRKNKVNKFLKKYDLATFTVEIAEFADFYLSKNIFILPLFKFNEYPYQII